MPTAGQTTYNSIATLTGLAIAAIRDRLFKSRTWRPVLATILTGRPTPAADKAAVLAATTGDVTATATALKTVMDLTATEARVLQRTIRSNRTMWARIRGLGTTAALPTAGGGGAIDPPAS